MKKFKEFLKDKKETEKLPKQQSDSYDKTAIDDILKTKGLNGSNQLKVKE